MLTVFFAICTYLPHAHAQDITTDLVGYWNFEDGAGTNATDQTASNNSTLYNMDDADWVTGKVGSYALDFDGSNDYVTRLLPASMKVSNFTVSVWVNFDAVNAYQNIVAASPTGAHADGRGFGLGLNNTGKIEFRKGRASGSWDLLASSATLSTGTWYHVAATYDGSTMQIYIDGAIDNSAAEANGISWVNAGSWSPSPEQLYFGAWRSNVSPASTVANLWFMDGRIDDVHIYSRALDAPDIAKLYDSTLPCDADYEAVMIYNEDEGILQYCDGTDWIAMGPKDDSGGDTGGTCALPDGVPGEVDYNYTQGVLQYCNGINWINMGPISRDASLAAQIPTTGLVGHWALDESGNTSTAEDDAGSNDGTLTGFPIDPTANWVSGKTGNALSFDGSSDYIALPDLGLFELDAFTVSGWFKTSDSSGYPNVYAEGNTSNGTPVFETYVNPDGSFTAFIRDTAGTSANLAGGSNYNNNTWHHMVVTQNSKSERYLYIDNVLIDSNTTTIGAVSVNKSNIGVLQRSSFSEYFKGELDDIRVYSVALDADEVEALYEGTGGGGTGGTCSSPDGPVGELVYNDDESVMQYCNGSEWIGIAKGDTGGGGGGDSTPDAFSFTDDTDVTTNTLTSSDIIQITGMDNGTTISVSGDGTPAYRICSNSDCSSEAHTWSTSSGSIDATEYVQLRLTSNASNSTMNSATLTIGTGSDQWDVTTEAAGPSTGYVDPDGDGVTTSWTTNGTCTGGDYGCIDDGTRSPTVPDTTNYLSASSNDQITIHTLGTIPGASTITSIEVYSYISNNNGCAHPIDIEAEISLDSGSTWETLKTHDLCQPGSLSGGASGWLSLEWTGTWNNTELSNLQVRYTTKQIGAAPPFPYIHAAYAEITY